MEPMEEGAEPPVETAEMITETQAAEELRRIGAELRSVLGDEQEVTAQVMKAVRHADQAGISRVNVTGLMGIMDSPDALRKARAILRRMRQPGAKPGG